VPGWWEPILERHSLTAEIDPGETEPFAIPKPLEFTTQGADWRKFFRLQIAVFVNGVDGLAFIERVQFRVKRK